MNLIIGALPILAVILGQIDASASPSLAIYGPLGIFCGWLMWREERRSQEAEKLRTSIDGVAHEMRGVNLNFLMVQASHGPDGLKALAQKELERKQAKG